MSISIDKIVKVSSKVITTSLSQAALIGNFLTENLLVPADDNRTLDFNSLNAVGAYFGTTSNEYEIAKNYFYGYDGSLTKPTLINFSRYVQVPTVAYMFSSIIANPSTTVNAIKALSSPSFIANINGSSQVLVLDQTDFASATGLTDIASIIQTALDAELSSCTVTVYNNRFIISAPNTVPEDTIISYCSGNVADLMLLSEATKKPTLSQGTTGGNAAYNMDLIINANPNWMALSYVTRLENDNILNSYAVTVDLTSWLAGQENNYIGLWWEGGTPPLSLTDNTNMANVLVSAGYGVKNNAQIVYSVAIQVDYNGLNTINSITNDEIGRYSAFVTGIGASINYGVVNSKINFAGKAQTGLPVNVTNNTNYTNLLLNGYNVYGQFASRTTTYNFNEQGQLGGIYAWIDDAYDGVWLGDQMQNKVATLIQKTGRLPYNDDGIAQINATLSNVVQSGLDNGVIEPGNTFDAIQIQEIITLVGQDVSPILTATGYYIYFAPFTPAQRVARAPITVYMLYTNGGAINQVSIGQIFVA